MAFVVQSLFNESIPWAVRDSALGRIYSDPGIPKSEGSTSSFWMKKPHSRLTNIKSKELPKAAEVVIIGSGITATSVAKSLLYLRRKQQVQPGSNERDPTIIMLEARDICSGATGRNGGHCLETAEDYVMLKENFGKESAAKIIRFRLAQWKALRQVAHELKLDIDDVQMRSVQFLSTYFDQTTWQQAKTAFLTFSKDFPEEAQAWGVLERAELEKKHNIRNASGAIFGPAGALWPYKFVTAVLDTLLDEFGLQLAIESRTPAERIIKQNEFFEIYTPRGVIRSRHVVHCTNSHIGHLVSGLRGRIFPVRGQMSAQKPPLHLENQSHKSSWLLNWEKGFDYLTQLPHVDGVSNGEMMLGGGFAQTYAHGISELGISRDDGLNHDASKHLNRGLAFMFDQEGPDSRQASEVFSMWSGIMGFSADGLPWVGRIPESLTGRDGRSEMNVVQARTGEIGGEWLAAGFSGEGMVYAWLCGDVLARLIHGSDQNQSSSHAMSSLPGWFPQEMLISEHRVKCSPLPPLRAASTAKEDTGLQQSFRL